MPDILFKKTNVRISYYYPLHSDESTTKNAETQFIISNNREITIDEIHAYFVNSFLINKVHEKEQIDIIINIRVSSLEHSDLLS